MESCLSCKFTTSKDGGSLSCQRYPQQLRVARSYWCGEYAADAAIVASVRRKQTKAPVLSADLLKDADI